MPELKNRLIHMALPATVAKEPMTFSTEINFFIFILFFCFSPVRQGWTLPYAGWFATKILLRLLSKTTNLLIIHFNLE